MANAGIQSASLGSSEVYELSVARTRSEKYGVYAKSPPACVSKASPRVHLLVAEISQCRNVDSRVISPLCPAHSPLCHLCHSPLSEGGPQTLLLRRPVVLSREVIRS